MCVIYTNWPKTNIFMSNRMDVSNWFPWDITDQHGSCISLGSSPQGCCNIWRPSTPWVGPNVIDTPAMQWLQSNCPQPCAWGLFTCVNNNLAWTWEKGLLSHFQTYKGYRCLEAFQCGVFSQLHFDIPFLSPAHWNFKQYYFESSLSLLEFCLFLLNAYFQTTIHVPPPPNWSVTVSLIFTYDKDFPRFNNYFSYTVQQYIDVAA